MPRPARWSRPRRRRCPRRRAAYATGTTASRGSATPRSCCGACTRSASTRRPTTSSTSSATSSPRRARTSCRSCTGSAARPSSRSRRSTTSPATRTRGRCASATARTTSASTTCGARCSTRSGCTRSRATGSPSRRGRSSSSRSKTRSATGASRTAPPPWREPARGIWEARGEPRHFTSSKLMCWVACDRGARLARLREDSKRAARWQDAADEIHADICANAIDERGVFCQHYDTDALDASCLLIPLVRFLPPDDERVKETVNAIDRELTEHGLVLRYRVSETDDGLVGEEGSFAICSFWLVSALAEIGESTRARALCERLLSFASPLGLFAEEIDANSGRH